MSTVEKSPQKLGKYIPETSPRGNYETMSKAQTRGPLIAKEYEAFAEFLHTTGCRGTFLFFGSARAMSQSAYDSKRKELTDKIAASPDSAAEAKKQLENIESKAWTCAIYEVTRMLAKLLSEWSMSDEGRFVGDTMNTLMPENHADDQTLMVCSGGGPGFMAAANEGASDAKSKSMGVAVVLPFETEYNEFVTQNLRIRLSTFYGRKYWEVFCAKAIIVAPGGMGTCDELFECLTLMQCKHMPVMPLVLLGTQFWNDTIDFHSLSRHGMCTKEEIDRILITDDPQAAFDFIRSSLLKEANANAVKAKAAAA